MPSSQSTASSEADRVRYSQDLAAYTLRQFSKAHLSIDKNQFAAARVPPSIAARMQSILNPKTPDPEQSSSRSVVA